MIKALYKVFLFLGFCMIYSCDNGENSIIEVSSVDTIRMETLAVRDIRPWSVVCGGHIAYDGGAEVALRGVCWSKQPNPTRDGFHTKDGLGDGFFESAIIGLESGVKYYVRAYAINLNGISYGDEVTFRTKEIEKGSFKDERDDQIYNWVKIGKQTWMAENLNVSAAEIDAIDGDSASLDCTHYQSYVWANGDCGQLYSWLAAMSACPSGWHLPTHQDWSVLENSIVADKVKEDEVGLALKSVLGWESDGNGTDIYGFAGMPSGYCADDAVHFQQGKSAYWWSSTSYKAYNAVYRALSYSDSTIVNQYATGMHNGLSIRCVKDF